MKIALLHPDLQAGGGAEAYAASILETLHQAGHEVDVWDIHRPHLALKLLKRVLAPFTLLKYAVVCRVFRFYQHSYQGVIGSFAETPCQRSWVIRHSPNVFGSDNQNLRWNMVGTTQGRKAYVRICKWIAGPQDAQALVVNSPWTQARLQNGLRGKSRVVVPPLNAPFPLPQRGQKRHGFVMIGRLVAHKNMLEGAALCQRLNLPLTIIGSGRGKTARAVEKFASRHQNTRVLAMSENEKWHSLHNMKFGLHLARHEHFGIAVCEMIHAGVLPFVCAQSGAAEVVAHPAYLYETLPELEEKIIVAQDKPDEALQHDLAQMRQSPLYQATFSHKSSLQRSLEAWEEQLCL